MADDRWLFIERTDLAPSGIRTVIYIMLLPSAAWLLFAFLLFTAPWSTLAGGYLLKGLILLAGWPLVVIWLWRMIRKHARKGKQLMVDQPTSTVAIREVQRGKVLWEAESRKDQFRVSVQPCACEDQSLKGFCVTVRQIGATPDRAMLLALTREREACVRYATDVLASVGLKFISSDECLSIQGLGASGLGRSDESILVGVSRCAKCRYDLTGIGAAVCPECGHARLFVPKVSRAEHATD